MGPAPRTHADGDIVHELRSCEFAEARRVGQLRLSRCRRRRPRQEGLGHGRSNGRLEHNLRRADAAGHRGVHKGSRPHRWQSLICAVDQDASRFLTTARFLAPRRVELGFRRKCHVRKPGRFPRRLCDGSRRNRMGSRQCCGPRGPRRRDLDFGASHRGPL